MSLKHISSKLNLTDFEQYLSYLRNKDKSKEIPVSLKEYLSMCYVFQKSFI